MTPDPVEVFFQIFGAFVVFIFWVVFWFDLAMRITNNENLHWIVRDLLAIISFGMMVAGIFTTLILLVTKTHG